MDRCAAGKTADSEGGREVGGRLGDDAGVFDKSSKIRGGCATKNIRGGCATKNIRGGCATKDKRHRDVAIET